MEWNILFGYLFLGVLILLSLIFAVQIPKISRYIWKKAGIDYVNHAKVATGDKK